MEGLWDKYSRIKEVFYRDFVYDSSYTEQASCIPLSSVKDGVGWVGDGTINLAQYLQFIYTEMILGNKTEDDVRNSILVLTRLADTTYDLFFNSNKGIYFKFEKGFFLRDDIHSEDANKFGLTKISSGYTNGIELKDEDPCFSPFTSQDQIWNLAPILAFLSEKGFEEARQAGYDILSMLLETVIKYIILIIVPCFIIGHSFLIWIPIRSSRGIGLATVTRILNTKLRLREVLTTGTSLEGSDGRLRSLVASIVHSGTAYGINHLYS